MTRMTLYTSLALATVMVAAAVGGAQQAMFKRTELQRGDLSISGREAVQTLAEIPSGVASGRHTHPGEEIGYIVEGVVVMEVEGKPPVTLKAGDVFLIPAGRIHNARNIGTVTSKMLSTYVVEKGKPLASPVP
jgi:quercetin dioxygenase-like cupin family protein